MDRLIKTEVEKCDFQVFKAFIVHEPFGSTYSARAPHGARQNIPESHRTKIYSKQDY